MNTTRKNIVVNTLGALIITTALAIGAGVGHVATPPAPANASTPQQEAPCDLLCGSGHGGSGSVGHLPNPLLDGASGGVGTIAKH